MALDAPAPLYPTSYLDNTGYTQEDMASLVASTSSGFTGPNHQQHQQHHYQQQQYQQNSPAHAQSLSHNSQAHAQAQAQAQAAQQQQQPQLSQSLAGVGRRHRTVPAKTFKCTGFGDCAMVFSRSEHLARHVRKHTGERPFACHCSKQFSRLDNLRQHAQTVHADRPELNARMMARLVEVQGTMATLGKSGSTGSTCSSAAPAGPSNSKPHPPRALSLSLSLETNTSMHIKSEGGSPDLSLHSQHPHPSLQQRKRRPGLPLTLSSADIAAANLNAGFHVQGHATAPLPHGYHHPLSSHGGHGYTEPQPHSASAQQTHFAHTQAPQTFSPSFSLDRVASSHHGHPSANFARSRGVDYTQSEYGVPSHSHSDFAGGSPAHEFPFHANAHANGVRSQALPSPPYSAASASGYFPSMPQQMMRGHAEEQEVFEQQQQQAYNVKQEELNGFEHELAAFPHAHTHAAQPQRHEQQHQLHHQHSQTWSDPSQHGGAYVSPPITPHLANFPSLSLGGSTAGSLSPHSAFSQSPTIPPSVGGGAFEAGFDGSAYEGSLSPEQQGFETGYVHQQQQAHEFEQFDKFEHAQHVEHFDHRQQQQQEYYASPEQQQFEQQNQQQQFFAAQQQQQQQNQQRHDRWMAQQQYRREHGFAA
ncbi:hypothetical protein D9619_012026 [Psilocybe cf. subviscida]|uniref:C2H2-type domain-containing protein n=1 Tax=Psilocybe cf. subviscida TaxID=2480587 RepID=A0A8H5EZ85_9AGAR|nr:hypothetical protein D9619_012026 [Psilocybe cf. subviscida]